MQAHTQALPVTATTVHEGDREGKPIRAFHRARSGAVAWSHGLTQGERAACPVCARKLAR